MRPSLQLRKDMHHSNKVQSPHSGTWTVAKPLKMGWFYQFLRQRECKEDTGHCYHAEEIIDWFCCECGKETDGMPPHDCKFCQGKIVK